MDPHLYDYQQKSLVKFIQSYRYIHVHTAYSASFPGSTPKRETLGAELGCIYYTKLEITGSNPVPQPWLL